MSSDPDLQEPRIEAPPPIASSGRFGTVLLRPGVLVNPRVRSSAWFLLGTSLVSTLICVLVARFLFPEAAGLVAVSLIAFSLLGETVTVLEEDRDVVWTYREPSWRANARLARRIVALFLGIFAGFWLMTFLLPGDSVRQSLGSQLSRFVAEYTRIQGIEFGSVGTLLRVNVLVLLSSFLFALVFRAGGALLVLGWNASVWGSVYAFLVRTQPTGRFSYGIRVLVATLPHIVLEAGGYILAMLSGIFLSRAMVKHGWGTPAFRSVCMASVRLLAIGIVATVLAAVTEAWATPWIARHLFG